MRNQESGVVPTQVLSPDKHLRALVLEEMARIQNSHAFRNSARAKEFLSYVVEHSLEGGTGQLKERSIGVNLFHRSHTYATGDDPIVRVQAAEVRKRLGQYYTEEEHEPKVRIEIPVGSYIPEFHWGPPAHSTPALTDTPVIPQSAPRPKFGAWKTAVMASVLAILGITVAAGVLAMLGIKVAIVRRNPVQPPSPLDQFWAPVLATGQPVLICISSPVTFLPSLNFLKKNSQAHRGLYDSPLETELNPLQLDPNTPLEWKDIVSISDEEVAKVHVYAVVGLVELFDRIHKLSQVKIGSDISFNDLQNSPAVLLGAFDNPWSVRMTADLPFHFREQDRTIVEKGGQERVWRTGQGPANPKDFAIVARLLNSQSGQFLVILGGISDPGSVAAGKLVSRPDLLSAALRSAPPGWQNKNLEFVIETDRIGNSDSSTRVIAVKVW